MFKNDTNKINIKYLSDEELVSLVQLGYKTAYEYIVVRYEPKIRRYINYLLSDVQFIDDIVQETFLNAYLNINSYTISKNFSSWLYRIAHNKAIDYMRKKTIFSFDLDFDLLSNIFVSKESPENDFNKEELSKNVKNCLSSLPLKYREVLTLFYLEDKNYDEISDILRLSSSNIGVRINRGKKLLKDICSKGDIYA